MFTEVGTEVIDPHAALIRFQRTPSGEVTSRTFLTTPGIPCSSQGQFSNMLPWTVPCSLPKYRTIDVFVVFADMPVGSARTPFVTLISIQIVCEEITRSLLVVNDGVTASCRKLDSCRILQL